VDSGKKYGRKKKICVRRLGGAVENTRNPLGDDNASLSSDSIKKKKGGEERGKMSASPCQVTTYTTVTREKHEDARKNPISAHHQKGAGLRSNRRAK